MCRIYFYFALHSSDDFFQYKMWLKFDFDFKNPCNKKDTPTLAYKPIYIHQYKQEPNTKYIIPKPNRTRPTIQAYYEMRAKQWKLSKRHASLYSLTYKKLTIQKQENQSIQSHKIKPNSKHSIQHTHTRTPKHITW